MVRIGALSRFVIQWPATLVNIDAFGAFSAVLALILAVTA
jgi:hypothetical protein